MLRGYSPIGGQSDSGGILEDFTRTVVVGVEEPNRHETIVGGDGVKRIAAEASQSTVAKPPTAFEWRRDENFS